MSDVSDKVTIRDRGKTSGVWITRAGDGLAVSHGYGWFGLNAAEWEAFKAAGDRLLAGGKCRCILSGGELLPLVCPVHGTPCEYCGGLEGCKEDCNGG